MQAHLVRLLAALLVVSSTAFAAGPTLSLPGTITTEAKSQNGTVVSYRATSDGVSVGEDEDGRGASASCAPKSGSLFPVGTTVVTCNAKNAAGETSTGSFNVNVVDTTAPSMTLPNVVEVTTNASSAVATWTATASDIVSGDVPVTCTPPSGSTFSTGLSIVECSASDGSGNTATDTFEVSVVGTTPAVLNLPNQSAEATGPTGAIVLFDFLDQIDDVVCTPASGTLFAVGSTTVNCTKGTLAGNFTVNVVDTTPPALTVPADIIAEATSSAGASVTFSALASDLVDGSVTPSCTPASGSTFALGTTAVTCTATDAHSNSTSDSFEVTVRDTTPPVILSLTANPATLWPPNKKMVAVTLTAEVMDAADPAPLVRIFDVTANEPITNADWSITGPLTINLRADRSGTQKSGRIYTLYVEAVDAAGNVSVAKVTVTVPHDQSGKQRSV